MGAASTTTSSTGDAQDGRRVREIVRVATAGSVDDGKSTLVGRLLYDTGSIFTDQLHAVARASAARGLDHTDLALLTDGLRAEREQGITIDVAYRYFATPRRSFILADTPGHVQYTRNMVTGASTADVALVLVDARTGLTVQTRRHAYLASLLRVPHVVLCINKMDLVDHSRDVFEAIREDFAELVARLDVHDLIVVPISALHGDNVVERSAAMPWYGGASLLHHLEEVHVNPDRDLIDVRLPVQRVVRVTSPAQAQAGAPSEYRGYAGQVAGGVLRPGDEVMVLPSGLTTRIAGIDTPGGPLAEAYPPMSVLVRLEDDLDVSRGDMICRPLNAPAVRQDVEAMVCWLDEAPMRPGGRYALKHTTRSVRAVLEDVRHRIDVTTGHRADASGGLRLNEIGRVALRTTAPVVTDPYRVNRTTGSFVLIDEATNATVAAGMVL